MSFTSKLALFDAIETSKIAENIIGVENQIIEKIIDDRHGARARTIRSLQNTKYGQFDEYIRLSQGR